MGKSDVIAARMAGHWTLDDSRWESHKREHDQLAGALRSYKAESNEWRGTISDLRGSLLTMTEYRAENRVLENRVALMERDYQRMQGALSIARFVGFGGLALGFSALVWAVVSGRVF